LSKQIGSRKRLRRPDISENLLWALSDVAGIGVVIKLLGVQNSEPSRDPLFPRVDDRESNQINANALEEKCARDTRLAVRRNSTL
jgi:hypothetical protein